MTAADSTGYVPPTPPEGLLETAERVRIETPDLDGNLRGKLVDADKFRPARSHVMLTEAYLSLTVGEEIAATGIGSPETGYGDLILHPDWSTARPAPHHDGLISVLCDGRTKEGGVHPVHPRSVLGRIADDFAAEGLEAKFGVEFEFWIFRLDERSRAALEEGRMSELTPSSRLAHSYSLARWPDCADFFDDLLAAMGQLGAPIETVMTEMGQGMFEAALAPLPPVAAADAAVRFKLTARELAARHGLLVSFIAKLSMDQSGSSGHLHQSVTRDGENLIWGGEQGAISAIGGNYLAGLLRATRECGVVMAPYPNSYRRFGREFFAPDSACWAHDNRHACVRAITLDAKSARFEQRRPGADMQPYLTIGACLGGGLWGIRNGAQPPAAATGSCEPEPGSELAGSLAEATETFARSEFAREIFGDALVDAYTALRTEELRSWERLNGARIPDWELARYLEVV
jgi:glutamine synthetase